MTKLSERIQASAVVTLGTGRAIDNSLVVGPLVRAAEALEADLADANARAMELTARCDRMRDVVRAREAETLAASAEADELRAELLCARGDVDMMRDAVKRAEADAYETPHTRCFADKGRWMAGMGVVHFFDLARLDVVTERMDGRCKCVVAQICGAPGDTHTECEERGARDQEAYEHGMADGIGCHQGDQRAMHRRAQAAESRATKLAREAATLWVRLQGAIAKIPPGPKPEPDHDWCNDINCKECDSDATFIAEYDTATGVLGPIETIPPVALEASDGGARMLDKAPRTKSVSELTRERLHPAFVPPSSGGARGLDAAERLDMDRQYDHVFHAAFGEREGHEALCDHRAAIAERDARIAELTRERLCADASYTSMRRTCFQLRDANQQLAIDGARIATARDEAIARAERAERSEADVRRMFDITRVKVAAAGGLDGSKGWWDIECGVAALRVRAERAEAVIAKVRECIPPGADMYASWRTLSDAVRHVLSALPPAPAQPSSSGSGSKACRHPRGDAPSTASTPATSAPRSSLPRSRS